MTRLRWIVGGLLAAAVSGSASSTVHSHPAAAAKRLSFDNRLLLNRAVLNGLRRLDVAILANDSVPGGRAAGTRQVVAQLDVLGGRAAKVVEALGYLRVEVPTERLLDLVNDPAVGVYQILSLSKGAWYRDGPPPSNAEMFRSYEVTPIAAAEPVLTHRDLPPLSPAEARAPGFTADDAGVGRWLADHPTYDGRGVTIALLESATPSFTNAIMAPAKTLDGRPVAKIAGIVNTIDPTVVDDTRVDLETTVDAAKTWARIGSRTYVLPHPGRYRFGTLDVPGGGNVIQRFAIVEDETTREVWIDTNGNASFQDETPLSDVNGRFDPRWLVLSHPRKAEVSFVMAHDEIPHVLHVYLGKSSHQTMTIGVAAGSRTEDGLASGVAPGARVLLVRASGSEPSLAGMFEGFIAAAARPDVDVISSSVGLVSVPDTAADFGGALMARLIEVYGKPIVIGAANTSQMLATAHAFGPALSVGGLLSPATYGALYGGRALDRLIVHPMGAAGPSLDGAIKPDIVAPMERLTADLPWNAAVDGLPRHAATRRLPPGYDISCCTSATAPYAAGVIALLMSAARQSGVNVTADRVRRALTDSARMIPGFLAHEQGNGAIDVNAAWRVLSRPAGNLPRIVASAAVVHPLAQYAADGPVGQGIFEVSGWHAGSSGLREITLHRESGPPAPLTYRLEWSGSDGTFSTPPSITLPLRTDVALPVRIDVRRAGAHSGLLSLLDPVTGDPVFRTQATIVATQQFDPSSGSLRVSGTVGLMRQHAYYVGVPAGVAAIAYDLEVTRGVVRPTIVPSSGLHSGYYMHVHPNNLDFMAKGRYHIDLPNPEPGTWTFRLDNDSKWLDIPGNPVAGDDDDAEFTLTTRVIGGSIRASVSASGSITADVTNGPCPIAEPLLDATPGYLTTHRGGFLPTGLPNTIEITVPGDAAALSLRLRSEREGVDTELHLYDCTTGECLSYNIGLPAADTHTLVVRKPNAGQWVAAVNAAPFPAAAGGFLLEEIITVGTPIHRASTRPLLPGARWQEVIGAMLAPPPAAGRT
ncbi:MAG TPA: S8 family serine peptidase, partial [Vicinamibacterales bacterium]